MRSTSMRGAMSMIAGVVSLPLLFLGGCGRTQPGADGNAYRPVSEAVLNRQISDVAQAAKTEFNTEQYNAITENPFIDALTEPQSTFSIDVDTASYANVRRMLQQGKMPPPGAVRIEELVNYFSYDYPAPKSDHPFSVSTELAVCPWQDEHQLLRVALQGEPIKRKHRPPCNLVFLLDVSGSMMEADKLPLVKSALHMLTTELKNKDRVAIVVYAGAAGLVLDSTSAREQAKILAAIEQLAAGGSTNGGQGIELAYRVASHNFIGSGINRVILCTDGDFNVGTTSDSALVELIQAQAASDIFLTVLGFGSGNLKDSKMEQLADKGNGNYAYIDSPLEARKVLVDQMGGTLVTIAKDVKIQLDFNPQYVQSYRLLGYENRLLENQDFRNDSKDAGEIGAGHTVTAFYELVPAGRESAAPTRQRPSEFVQPKLIATDQPGTLLTVNLRYKQPTADQSSEFQMRLGAGAERSPASTDFQFATAVVAYGLLLRGSQYTGTADWDWVIHTARKNLGRDAAGLRSEFVQLAKTARRISND